MSLYKNTISQKIAIFAYDKTTGAAKTGDAANITGYVSLDWGAANVIDDTNPAELDATNMPGWYVFDLTQAETNAEVIVVAAKSATANILIDQIQVFTENLAANHTGTVGSVTGAVGSVTGNVGGNVNGNVAGSVASVTAGVTLAAATHTGAVIPTVTAVTNDVGITQAGADKVWNSTTRTLSAFGFSVTVGTNNDKSGYSLSAAGVQAIWDALTSALTTVGSIGKRLVDNINATIGSRSSHSAADVWSSATRTLTGSLDPSAAAIADAVWDEAISAHLTAGSTGATLADTNIKTVNLHDNRLTSTRAMLLDKLGVSGTLAHSDAANLYKADVSALALEATAQAIVTAINNLNDPDAAAIVAAILAMIYEGSETFQDYLRLSRAALYGESTGGGTNTRTFRDRADTKARITATVDGSANRTAVTTDAT